MSVIEQIHQSVFLLVFYAGIFGAMVGSFINVVAYRLPLIKEKARQGERFDLSFPKSSCPQCGAPIRARHNIPVLGWLFLKGRCADCKTVIPVRYMLVELFSGLSSALIAYLLPLGEILFASILLFWWVLAMALTPNPFKLRYYGLWFPTLILSLFLLIKI